MSTAGIVCEYNPFHKGHQYQIEQTKAITGADHIICFMSGSFLQRGIPALADKYTRAEIAIRCGADAVFEIPFVYATSSARDYATAAIHMMNACGCIDYISFGAETDDLQFLSCIAHIVTNEPPEVSKHIRSFMASGYTYSIARASAVADYIHHHPESCCNGTEPGSSASQEELKSILASPNNILAIEYLSALMRTGSSIKPVLIPRKYSGYNSTSTDHDICSASAIRNMLMNEASIDTLRRHVPEQCFDILADRYRSTFPIFEDDMSYLLNVSKLLQNEPAARQDIVDMDHDLFNRYSKLSAEMSFSETSAALKCRNYTMTHIQRGLLHSIIGLKNDDYQMFKHDGWIYYMKLLGLRVESGSIVKAIKKSSPIPVITRHPELNLLQSQSGKTMAAYDTKASSIYNNIIYRKYNTHMKDEFRQSIIRA